MKVIDLRESEIEMSEINYLLVHQKCYKGHDWKNLRVAEVIEDIPEGNVLCRCENIGGLD